MARVDELLKQDCTVIYESMYEVHVSGHACQEELKMMQALTKPKYFIPVHGEQKHLRKHAGLAMAMGMAKENIFIGDIGNVLELHEDHMKQLADVPRAAVMVGRPGRGRRGQHRPAGPQAFVRGRPDCGGVLHRRPERQGGLRAGYRFPRVCLRPRVRSLMDEARDLVYNTLEECARNRVRDWSGMKQSIKDELSRFLYQKDPPQPHDPAHYHGGVRGPLSEKYAR